METKRIKLKKIGLVGTLGELYLKSDEGYNRENDLYRAYWDNGKTGIVELKNLEFI